MKNKQRLLTLRKTQIAKINSFQIIGGDLNHEDSSIECFSRKSRTPSTGQTQTHTYAIDCEGTTDI